MQRISLVLRRVVYQGIFILGLISLIALSGLFLTGGKPSYAATTHATLTQEHTDQSSPVNDREEAYEEAIEAASEPRGVEKEYKKELKEFKEENPGQIGIAKDAKNLLNKVTGND